MRPSRDGVRRRLWRALTRRRGDRATDLVLWVVALLGLAGIALSLMVPGAAALVVFVVFSVWTNGPHSPLLPAAHEPVLMLYGRLYPPWIIAALGTAAILLAEWINYHIYRHAADLPALSGVRHRRTVRWAVRLFERSPFAAMVVFALGLLPYWIGRLLSVLSGYPLGRHLAATAIGRFPRLWLFAALGGLAIPSRWLVAVAVGSIVAAAVFAAVRILRARRPRPSAIAPPGSCGPMRGLPAVDDRPAW
jgi:hypothetical protein